MLTKLLRVFRVVCFVLPAVALLAKDFATPKDTLDTYIEALRAGDKETVLTCFHPELEDFGMAGPIPIESYVITKETVFGESEAEEWNSAGIIPRAEIGDVDLEVEEKEEGNLQMFSYLMREVDGQWKIIAYCAWGVD